MQKVEAPNYPYSPSIQYGGQKVPECELFWATQYLSQEKKMLGLVRQISWLSV